MGHQRDRQAVGHQRDRQAVGHQRDRQAVGHQRDRQAVGHQRDRQTVGHQRDRQTVGHQRDLQTVGHQRDRQAVGHQRDRQTVDHQPDGRQTVDHQRDRQTVDHQRDRQTVDHQRDRQTVDHQRDRQLEDLSIPNECRTLIQDNGVGSHVHRGRKPRSENTRWINDPHHKRHRGNKVERNEEAHLTRDKQTSHKDRDQSHYHSSNHHGNKKGWRYSPRTPTSSDGDPRTHHIGGKKNGEKERIDQPSGRVDGGCHDMKDVPSTLVD